QNFKLVAEITELKKEKAEFLAKEAGFMTRIMELEQITKKAKLRDTELNTRIIELERSSEKRFVKLEQNQNNTVVKLENDDSSSEKDINVPDSVINKYIDHVSSADTNTRSLEDDTPASDITDNVSNSDVCLEPLSQMKVGSHQYFALPIHTELKSLKEKEEDEFLNSTYKEQVSREIMERIREKKLWDQNLSLDNSHSVSASGNLLEQPTLSYDIKTIMQSEKSCDSEPLTKCSRSESFSYNEKAQSIILSRNGDAITAESIVYIFYKAIQSGQKGIFYWHYFAKKYDNKIDELVVKCIKRKTATSMIYREIKQLLPDITDGNL
ncbi:3415_t:CDS:2, partial [Diversispora eburnea]